MALDDLVNRDTGLLSVLGKEGPIQETARIGLGGLAGAAMPIVLGACGALTPQVAMNPLTWFYSGGLGMTAAGVYQLDSLAGKVMMTIPALGYFLPKTLEALSYGLTLPYASGVLGAVGAGISSATGYIASVVSYASSYVGMALPYIGIGLAAAGIVYAGYRVVKGWLNKIKGRRTYNGKKKSKSKPKKKSK